MQGDGQLVLQDEMTISFQAAPEAVARGAYLVVTTADADLHGLLAGSVAPAYVLPVGDLPAVDLVKLQTLVTKHAGVLNGLKVSLVYLAVDGDGALHKAASAFTDELGLPASRTEMPKLVIHQSFRDAERKGRLAWQVDVQAPMDGAKTEGFTYWIDAETGALLEKLPNVHDFDVGGNVTSRVTPGTAPDSGGNPPIPLAMRFLRVQSSAGTITTDTNGNFNYPGVN